MILEFKGVGGIEASSVPGLDSCGGILIGEVGDDDVADVVSELGWVQLEVAFSSEVDLGSFFKSSPAVSELDTLIWVVDDGIGVERVDTKGSDSFSGNSLNNLPWGKGLRNDVFEVRMVTT